MTSKVLYQKTFPRRSVIMKGETAADLLPDPLTDPAGLKELLRDLERSNELVLMEDRIEKANRFVTMGIELSELYRVDISVTRHDSHITINYSFDCCAFMVMLKQIFQMADDISFFANIHGKEITISLDYYTHLVLKDGRVLAPFSMRGTYKTGQTDV